MTTAIWIICQILLLLIILSIFRYVPQKGEELYTQVIVKRGLHIFCPENSLKSFELATRAKLAVSIDVRRTKDGKLICFHDKYTKRILNIPGKISIFKYEQLKKFKLNGTDETVPLFEQVLKVVDGKVPVYIQLRGKINKQYLISLENLINRYNGKLYFETKSLSVYIKLKKRYKYIDEKCVYYTLNPFRKRPQFIRGKEYDFQQSKYYQLIDESKAILPTIEDISSIIVRSMEELENKKEILATIGKVINRCETRISDEHWVKNSLWLHRSIVSDKYPEHSKESFEACVKFASKNNLNITLEFDLMMYKGEIKCYHKDKISSVLGQDSSCAEKIDIDKTLTFDEILDIVSEYPNINLAIDIKDFHVKNRILEEKIIQKIEDKKYNGNFILMSFNPFVLNYFKKTRPEWLRAQIGHSLKGLKEKIPFFRFPWVINGLLGMLFDLSEADCVVMDNSNWLYYLISFHKNVQGKPVLIYAPKSYMEQEAFVGRDSVANFIVENISSEQDWPKEHLEKFKNTH